VFEEYQTAGSRAIGVRDVNVVAAVVFMCIAHVVPSGRVGGPMSL